MTIVKHSKRRFWAFKRRYRKSR